MAFDLGVRADRETKRIRSLEGEVRGFSRACFFVFLLVSCDNLEEVRTENLRLELIIN